MDDFFKISLIAFIRGTRAKRHAHKERVEKSAASISVSSTALRTSSPRFPCFPLRFVFSSSSKVSLVDEIRRLFCFLYLSNRAASAVGIPSRRGEETFAPSPSLAPSDPSILADSRPLYEPS